MGKTQVLVVDDSAAGLDLLRQIIGADPELNLVGSASNGADAVSVITRVQPDVVLIAVNKPFEEGLTATRAIMDKAPRPIIMLYPQDDAAEPGTVFSGIEAGALAVLARPHGLRHPRHDIEARELLQTLKTLSEVKVVRRRAPRATGGLAALPAPEAAPHVAPQSMLRLVAVGASTGGPPVIRRIIADLPRDFPLPVIIVQHISVGFTADFVNWLSSSTGYPVSVAVEGERLLPGRAYVAPEGVHTTVTSDLRVALSKTQPEHGMRPAVSALFRSVAASVGSRAMGVLLTGMGQDGAAELALLRTAGAVTIAQDAASSVVFGMPGEAIRLGGAAHICAADELPGLIVSLAQNCRVA